MNREYSRWVSRSLGRTMEFLWFGDAGLPVILFPTSLGRFYQYEDFGLVGSLAGKVETGEIQLVCVDSIDAESWFNKSAPPSGRAERHNQYDQYLHEEMIPYVLNRTQQSDLTVFGASLGAYHAANFAARYPEVVRKAVLFSGVYDIHQFLDAFWNDTCYFHCPTAYIPNMDESWTRRLSSVTWIIATGEHDSLVQDNRGFSELLWSKGIPNYSEIWPGVFGHDWPWWNEHLVRFLP